jgi:hypothetical protein
MQSFMRDNPATRLRVLHKVYPPRSRLGPLLFAPSLSLGIHVMALPTTLVSLSPTSLQQNLVWIQRATIYWQVSNIVTKTHGFDGMRRLFSRDRSSGRLIYIIQANFQSSQSEYIHIRDFPSNDPRTGRSVVMMHVLFHLQV